jgi:hypothetical protein
VALTSGGQVYAWGENYFGQLGDGTNTNRNQPVLVATLSDITAIAGGGLHTVARKSDGTVWTFGMNDNGQLGDNSTTWRNAPVQMSGVSSAAAVGGGNAHTVILKSDGTLLASGWNGSGELGDAADGELRRHALQHRSREVEPEHALHAVHERHGAGPSSRRVRPWRRRSGRGLPTWGISRASSTRGSSARCS